MESGAYDFEAEAVFISALASTSCINVAEAKLLLEQVAVSQADFVNPELRNMFEATRILLGKNLPVDTLSVKTHAEVFKVDAFGGQQRMFEVLNSNEFFSAAHVRSLGTKLRTLTLKRNALSIISGAEQKILESDQTLSVIGEITSKLSGLKVESGASIRSLRDVMGGIVERIQEIQDATGEPILPTGIEALDRVLCGWQPTLNLVAALPGVGKSAFMATSIRYLGRRGTNIGIISLEDEPSWLGYRILSDESGVDQFILRFKKMTDKDFELAADGYKKIYDYSGNIYLADGSEIGMNIESIVHACHDLILNKGCKIIFLDHIGEINYDRRSAERYDLEVSRHLSLLRGIANKFGIPVIAATHIRRRDGLGMGDKPTPSDCANSSGAERRARVLIGLSRGAGSETLSIHILKNTNGISGKTVDVKFSGSSAMLAED